MIEEMKTGFRRLFSQNKDKKLRLLVILGLVGILLIALSEWLPRRSSREDTETPTGGTVSVAQVENALEQRITALIREVDGVGDCLVMVTLESGSRFVYAADQTHSDAAGSTGSSEKTLLVETDSGPVGLLVTEIQPSVKGVAIVCDGGGDPAVCRQVTGLVSAAFNISSGRVCVAKQK